MHKKVMRVLPLREEDEEEVLAMPTLEEERSLVEWFFGQMADVKPFELTEDEYMTTMKTASPHLLPYHILFLVDLAGRKQWGYWLSHIASINAALEAARAAGKLTIRGAHHHFTIGTLVSIKVLHLPQGGPPYFNVPAVIASVKDDRYRIVPLTPLGPAHQPGHDFSFDLTRGQLDLRLR